MSNSITGNIGEWSEFYAFVKVLAEKKLVAANEKLEPIPEKFYPILKLIRDEAIGKCEYSYDGNSVAIVINGESKGAVPLSLVQRDVTTLLAGIKTGKGTFSLEEGEKLLATLKASALKASSSQKADLAAVIKDRISPEPVELGFSVKSHMGSMPTLLNAGKTTNFTFIIPEMTELEMNRLNSTYSALNAKGKFTTKAKNKVEDLLRNFKPVFYYAGKERWSIFERNLRMIDTALPEIFGEMLLLYYGKNPSDLKSLYKELPERETLKKFRLTEIAYEYKLKGFLDAVATGMVPSKPWNGLSVTHGGYIVVRDDGDVLCYLLYDRDKFHTYLFNNTKLETASTSRHEFGMIYFDDEINEFCIKLNLSVRFL